MLISWTVNHPWRQSNYIFISFHLYRINSFIQRFLFVFSIFRFHYYEHSLYGGQKLIHIRYMDTIRSHMQFEVGCVLLCMCVSWHCCVFNQNLDIKRKMPFSVRTNGHMPWRDLLWFIWDPMEISKFFFWNGWTSSQF